MALVKNPFYSGQASGKVGSLVASRNRNGAYIRQNAKPVRPNTPTQTLRKYEFVQASNAFLQLSTTHVDEWNDFSDNYTVPNKLGDATRITGRNWFIGLNSRILALGVSVALSPPLNPEPTFLPNVSVAQTAAGNAITAGISVSLPAGSSLWVYGTNALTKTRRFKSGSMRLLTIFQTLTVAVNKTLIASANLVMDTSSYQFETRSVDAQGRATAPLRFTVFPVDT